MYTVLADWPQIGVNKMKLAKTALLAVIFMAIYGCTDNAGAVKALRGAGYTDIHVGGYNWFACSNNDTTSTRFSAKGPTGVQVNGAVCGGILFKNSTIRTE